MSFLIEHVKTRCANVSLFGSPILLVKTSVIWRISCRLRKPNKRRFKELLFLRHNSQIVNNSITVHCKEALNYLLKILVRNTPLSAMYLIQLLSLNTSSQSVFSGLYCARGAGPLVRVARSIWLCRLGTSVLFFC